ncbi:MAG: ketose-bisphosphate aldolase [Candidatus Paceibacterota bacterium]
MLLEHILKADSEQYALGHFNISTIDALWAIFEAAQEQGVPVLVGTSEGEREFIGERQFTALVKSLREEFNYPIYANADHTYSFEGVKRAADNGYDAVIFDGAQLPFEKNCEITERCVDYAKCVNPDMVVEGELGYIGTSSKLLDEIPEGVTREEMTTPDQAREFVKKTGVDLLAPSVGNIHGMLKNAQNPNLDIERIRAIRKDAGVPLVLHGGSGVSDEDFKKAIKAGISVVHINTEIRKAWRSGIEDALKRDTETVAPYKLLDGARSNVKEIVAQRIALFHN